MTDAWVQLINGGKFSLDGSPHELDGLTIADIAKQLAHLNRYRGATRFPVSVAAHSVMVSLIAEDMAGPRFGLYGLVHDAHEIVVSDIPSPLKACFADAAPGFAETLAWIESEADAVLWPILGAHFPMGSIYRNVVKRADLIALATEKRDACVNRRPWKLPEEASTRYCIGRAEVDDAGVFMRRLGDLHRKLGIETKAPRVTAL